MPTLPVTICTLMRPTGDTGVQTHVNAVAALCASASVPVRVVTPFSAPSAMVLPLLAPRVVLDRVSGAASVWWYRTWHEVCLRVALRRLPACSPAVFYAQCPPSARAALAVRAAAGDRVVMAVHFNVSQADEWAAQGRIRAGSRVFRGIEELERCVVPRVDGLVYPSEFVRAAVQGRIPAAAGVASVRAPNFLPDTAPDTPPPTAPRRDLISVGTLEPRKNQAYLLRVLAAAARRGRRYTLTLVGDGPDRRLLEALVDELGLDGQVAFMGRQDGAARLLPGHRLYVHSARMENLPMALVEALRAGVPVVAAPVGGIPEMFTDGIEGRCWDLGDPAAGAQVLTSILDDEPARRCMAAAARRRFESTFSEAAAGRRLLAFLGAACE